jgi:hypothetical protein
MNFKMNQFIQGEGKRLDSSINGLSLRCRLEREFEELVNLGYDYLVISRQNWASPHGRDYGSCL